VLPYCPKAQEPDSQLKDAFHDLRELKVNVVTPLLLELYGDHEAGLLSRGELLEALRLLESYVFRRAVCAIPSNSQQKTFATFGRALRRESGHYLPSFKAHLLNLHLAREMKAAGLHIDMDNAI
jgi:uncharacterized protein with ParB-like and HNH nuclease domain